VRAHLVVAADLVRALLLYVAFLLVLAVAHKVRVLYVRQAGAEPLIELGGWRKRHPSSAIALAAIGEIALAVVLVAVPIIGSAGVSLLLAFYAREVARLPADQPCNCFGEVLRTHDGGAAIRRNVVLAVATAGAFLAYATGAISVAPLSGVTFGIALILAAALAAAEVVRRFGESTRRESATGAG
jgi:hypothetical protein